MKQLYSYDVITLFFFFETMNKTNVGSSGETTTILTDV